MSNLYFVLDFVTNILQKHFEQPHYQTYVAPKNLLIKVEQWRFFKKALNLFISKVDSCITTTKHYQWIFFQYIKIDQVFYKINRRAKSLKSDVTKKLQKATSWNRKIWNKQD